MSEQEPQSADAAVELNNELKTRREKLSALRANGVAFPNDFRRDSLSGQLHERYDEKSNEELEDQRTRQNGIAVGMLQRLHRCR